MWSGTSQVVGHVYIQKDIVLILTKGGKGSQASLDRVWLHEEKSLKRHNLLCGRQCAGAYDCLANKKQKQSQLILTDGFWGYISNLKTFSQSVSSNNDKGLRYDGARKK